MAPQHDIFIVSENLTPLAGVEVIEGVKSAFGVRGVEDFHIEPGAVLFRTSNFDTGTEASQRITQVLGVLVQVLHESPNYFRADFVPDGHTWDDALERRGVERF